MVGQRFGLYSEDPMHAWAIDSSMEYAEENFAAMSKKCKTPLA